MIFDTFIFLKKKLSFPPQSTLFLKVWVRIPVRIMRSLGDEYGEGWINLTFSQIMGLGVGVVIENVPVQDRQGRGKYI